MSENVSTLNRAVVIEPLQIRCKSVAIEPL